jgi:orotidine-5'-phosphate decarboxylase
VATRTVASNPSGTDFASRLRGAQKRLGPLCCGIDPAPGTLRSWGLSDDADGVREFSLRMLEACQGQVAAIKPQIAFFERFGSRGFAVVEELIATARSGGLLVVLDAKRGDIGSTNDGYAQAYLGDGALSCDALTVSPYLGYDALRPLFDAAAANQRGIFVLARTSNPESTAVQQEFRRLGSDSETVSGHIVASAQRTNEASASPFVGVVFGATVDPVGHNLAAMLGTVLLPGIGAQGATPGDVARRFAGCRRQVLPAVSRGVTDAGPRPGDVRARLRQLNIELADALA